MDFQIEILTEQRQCQIFNLVFFRRTILEKLTGKLLNRDWIHAKW